MAGRGADIPQWQACDPVASLSAWTALCMWDCGLSADMTALYTIAGVFHVIPSHLRSLPA